MSCIDSYLIKNADVFQRQYIYKCDGCGDEMDESFTIYQPSENIDYCPECAFKKGLISEVEYCDNCGGISSSMFAAGINPETNEIELVKGSSKKKKVLIDKKHQYKNVRIKRNKFSWELTNNQSNKRQRGSEKYKSWRNGVFNRDNYTCQHCNNVGGELNAHHIKSWKDYKNLRFKIENGITLCLGCHRIEHKRLRGE